MNGVRSVYVALPRAELDPNGPSLPDWLASAGLLPAFGLPRRMFSGRTVRLYERLWQRYQDLWVAGAHPVSKAQPAKLERFFVWDAIPEAALPALLQGLENAAALSDPGVLRFGLVRVPSSPPGTGDTFTADDHTVFHGQSYLELGAATSLDVLVAGVGVTQLEANYPKLARGSGVKVGVVEWGWVVDADGWVDHPDLPKIKPRRKAWVSPNASYAAHGIATLGVLGAGDDATKDPVRGLAPEASIVVCGHHRNNASDAQLIERLVDAIGLVADKLGKGDVLLLEVQTEYAPGVNAPMEIDEAVRAAVTSLGHLVVVAAAGNSETSTETYVDETGLSWDSQDSGAVIVGALEVVARTRRPRTVYGSRVDCCAWGGLVRTSRTWDDDAGLRTYDHREGFSGTSSAAAIVAGAVAALQGVVRAHTGDPLLPAELRALLRNPELGTAPLVPDLKPATASLGEIGVMPDVSWIANQVLK